MERRFEGDELFCVVCLIASRFISGSVASMVISSGAPVSAGFFSFLREGILFALIIGLFYGPSPRHISKKVFAVVLCVMVAAGILMEFV